MDNNELIKEVTEESKNVEELVSNKQQTFEEFIADRAVKRCAEILTNPEVSKLIFKLSDSIGGDLSVELISTFATIISKSIMSETIWLLNYIPQIVRSMFDAEIENLNTSLINPVNKKLTGSEGMIKILRQRIELLEQKVR